MIFNKYRFLLEIKRKLIGVFLLPSLLHFFKVKNVIYYQCCNVLMTEDTEAVCWPENSFFFNRFQEDCFRFCFLPQNVVAYFKEIKVMMFCAIFVIECLPFNFDSARHFLPTYSRSSSVI